MLIAKGRLLTATWDTLGWALFREGKPENLGDAHELILAAWQNRPSADVAEHLGRMAEAKGDRNEALHYFELALDTFPSYLQPGVRKTPGARQKQLNDEVKRLIDSGAKEEGFSHEKDAGLALLRMRTFALGASNGVSGTAEYRLLLSSNGVEKLIKTNGKDMDDGEVRIRNAKLPGLFPRESEAKLVRSGMLNCHASVCELVVEP